MTILLPTFSGIWQKEDIFSICLNQNMPMGHIFESSNMISNYKTATTQMYNSIIQKKKIYITFQNSIAVS